MQVLEETQQSTHYIKTLRKILGDIFTNCNTTPPDFEYSIVDTHTDRALAIAIKPDNDRRFERKLDRFGLSILNKETCHTYSNDSTDSLIIYTLRIIEETDVIL